MIYAASKYIDQIRPRRQEHPKYCRDQWAYFPTEQEAKQYLIDRARGQLRIRELAVVDAKKRLSKVLKKFGVHCKHGIADQGECGLCHDERVAADRSDKERT